MKKAKIIKDKKRRGEWVEIQFMARAGEHGLPVSKPWGDSNSFDCVVGRPGKFVAVQVKSTLFRSTSGQGYSCSTCSSHKVYRAGAFDYLAAYVIPEDVWYIIPAKEILGKRQISLCTETGEAKYEPYREAWHLLREATAAGDSASGGEEIQMTEAEAAEGKAAWRPPANALGRMEASFNYVRKFLERGGGFPQKRDEEE